MNVRASRGFTLVELMVSLTLGLLLTVVVANLFLGSRATYATTDETSRMQENIRFAYQLLERTIHLAGYKSSPNSTTSQIFGPGNLAVSGTEGGGVGGVTPDSLTILFQGSGTGAGADGTVVDCKGREIDAGVTAINTFTIAAGANGGNALFCDNGIAPAVEVVSDIDNMQILYGEDTNTDLVADRYVPINTGGLNPDNIVSIRMALLFRTPNQGANALKDAGTYDLNGVVLGPFNDTRIRRVVTLNVNLRNRTP